MESLMTPINFERSEVEQYYGSKQSAEKYFIPVTYTPFMIMCYLLIFSRIFSIRALLQQ